MATHQIHVVDVLADGQGYQSSIYRHADEVQLLSCCPWRSDWLATGTWHGSTTQEDSQAATSRAVIYQIPQGSSSAASSHNPALISLAVLQGWEGQLRSILWDPNQEESGQGQSTGRIVTVDENAVRVWSLQYTARQQQAIMFQEITAGGQHKGLKFTMGAAWNPHQRDEIATGADMTLRGWDLRSGGPTFTIEQANNTYVRDVDFNPNRPNVVAVCGDDCKTRIFDIRQTQGGCLKEIGGHTHWVWSCKFNGFYDQLLLTGGSDSMVLLHGVASVSSAPHGDHYGTSSAANTTDDEQHKENQAPPVQKKKPAKESKLADGVLATIDQHQESVYSVAWSNADPWTYASLSYSGRLLISTVPSEDKYKLIL